MTDDPEEDLTLYCNHCGKAISGYRKRRLPPPWAFGREPTASGIYDTPQELYEAVLSRLKDRIPQNQIAKQCGVSTATVSRIKRGKLKQNRRGQAPIYSVSRIV